MAPLRPCSSIMVPLFPTVALTLIMKSLSLLAHPTYRRKGALGVPSSYIYPLLSNI